MNEEGGIDYSGLMPDSVTGRKMPGNATLLDYVDSAGKLFFTIVTVEGTLFYQVIDMDMRERNVYFMQIVGEQGFKSGLDGKADYDDETVVAAPIGEVIASATAPGPKGSGNKNIIIPGVIIMGVAILGWHFLKKGKAPARKATASAGSGGADFYGDSDDEVMSEEDFKDEPAAKS
jgi:hypothetical protein